MISPLSAIAGAGPADSGGPKVIHSEADLVLPDFHHIKFLGMSGWTLLAIGLAVCAIGLIFGLVIYNQLKKAPVHKSMRDVSELIYATCRTYLETQGKFIAGLWWLVAAVIVVYFKALEGVEFLFAWPLRDETQAAVVLVDLETGSRSQSRPLANAKGLWC